MRYRLLDSDILIDFLRGHQAARLLIRGLEGFEEVPVISVVSVAELVAGIRRGEEQATARLLSVFEKISVSETVARSAGLFLKACGRSHGLELGNALVAASALEVVTLS